jgi:hypothetical protein
MQAPEPMRSPEAVPIALELEKTDIPEGFLDALPRKGIKREQLILPTSARLFITKEGGLGIEMIAHDAEAYCSEYYKPPTLNDVDPPIISMGLSKQNILRLTIGGWVLHQWMPYPSAVLVISDPLRVTDGFSLTFSSTDRNNPDYWISALAKLLQDRLGVNIEVKNQIPPEPDTPF